MLRPLSIATLFLVSLLPVRGESLHFEDNFTNYPIAPLNEGWPTLHGSIAWHIGSNGESQEIRVDSESGHSSPVFSYSEVSRGALIARIATLNLPNRATKRSKWSLTVEFYIDSRDNPEVFGLVG